MAHPASPNPVSPTMRLDPFSVWNPRRIVVRNAWSAGALRDCATASPIASSTSRASPRKISSSSLSISASSRCGSSGSAAAWTGCAPAMSASAASRLASFAMPPASSSAIASLAFDLSAPSSTSCASSRNCVSVSRNSLRSAASSGACRSEPISSPARCECPTSSDSAVSGDGCCGARAVRASSATTTDGGARLGSLSSALKRPLAASNVNRVPLRPGCCRPSMKKPSAPRLDATSSHSSGDGSASCAARTCTRSATLPAAAAASRCPSTCNAPATWWSWRTVCGRSARCDGVRKNESSTCSAERRLPCASAMKLAIVSRSCAAWLRSRSHCGRSASTGAPRAACSRRAAISAARASSPSCPLNLRSKTCSANSSADAPSCASDSDTGPDCIASTRLVSVNASASARTPSPGSIAAAARSIAIAWANAARSAGLPSTSFSHAGFARATASRAAASARASTRPKRGVSKSSGTVCSSPKARRTSTSSGDADSPAASARASANRASFIRRSATGVPSTIDRRSCRFIRASRRLP